jgi:hypothetical protein
MQQNYMLCDETKIKKSRLGTAIITGSYGAKIPAQ